MLTWALAAISRVDAPAKPLMANTSSAVTRIRAFVEEGAWRALFSADRIAGLGLIQSMDRLLLGEPPRGCQEMRANLFSEQVEGALCGRCGCWVRCCCAWAAVRFSNQPQPRRCSRARWRRRPHRRCWRN